MQELSSMNESSANIGRMVELSVRLGIEGSDAPIATGKMRAAGWQ